MIEALHHLQEAIATATGVPAHIGDATGSLPPFTVLWSPQLGHDRDSSMGACPAWSAQLGVSCVGDNLERALELAAATVDTITPGRLATMHTTSTQYVQAQFFEQRSQDIGRAVTLSETDSHPATVVALFDIHAQPKGTP